MSCKFVTDLWTLAEDNPMTTPSHHRTRLGPDIPNTAQHHQRQFRPNGSFASGPTTTIQTPTQRNALDDVSNVPGSRSGVSGYGMSAGMKIGRQQGPHQSSASQIYQIPANHSIYAGAARPSPPQQPNPPPMRSRLGPYQ